MKTVKRVKVRPAPLPVIDLGGKVQVIDDSGNVPVWKTLGVVKAASVENAKRVLVENKLKGGFLVDGLGNREWVSV